MTSIENCKIRDKLKTAFLKYKEVKDFIFTTYDFDVDFFEEHIVSYLMDSKRKITTVDDLNLANEWVLSHHISVYYDKSALIPGKSSLTIPVYPQFIKENGNVYVFHPKVIIIYGTLAETDTDCATLFVSSCNLTVSGFGRNQEAFACIQINGKKIAESVSNFIKAISNGNFERHKHLISYLSKITEIDTDVVFFWNYKTEETLIEYLANLDSGELQIVSPYFDENGPQHLLSKLKNTTTKIIYPAVELSSDKYNIYIDSYKQMSHSVEFRELNHEDDRFVHAKILSIGNKTVIGSYNFTTAAMEGRNSEAALIFNTKVKLDSQKADENKFLVKENGDKLTNKDQHSYLDNIFVTVTVDWAKQLIEIKGENFGTEEKYSIRLKSASEEVELFSNLSKFLPEENLSLSHNENIAEVLLKHKSFVVRRDSERCFEGLINEINWKDTRPEIGCDNLYDTIREWYWIDEEQGGHRKIERLLYPSEENEIKELYGVETDSTNDIFDNYYLVSCAFENLIEKITETAKEKNIKKKTIEINSIIATKPGCILKMLSFLKTRNVEDLVYKFLISEYIGLILQLIDKRFKNILKEFLLEKFKLANNTYTQIKNDIENEIKQLLGNKKSLDFFDWIKKEFMDRKNV